MKEVEPTALDASKTAEQEEPDPEPSGSARSFAIPDRVEISAEDQARFEKHAREVYESRKAALEAHRAQSDTPDTNLEQRFIIAVYDYADLTLDDRTRARLAEEGMEACQKLIARNPANAFAHYFLAMHKGQLARTRSITALRLVREMESSLHRARVLDETLEYAGPHRILGRLYFEAPGWPTSIGSRQKARQHFERAVALSPDYMSNRLEYAEALAKWRQYEEASVQVRAALDMWEEARKRFNGPDWEDEWAEWEAQVTELKRQLSRTRWPIQ